MASQYRVWFRVAGTHCDGLDRSYTAHAIQCLADVHAIDVSAHTSSLQETSCRAAARHFRLAPDPVRRSGAAGQGRDRQMTEEQLRTTTRRIITTAMIAMVLGLGACGAPPDDVPGDSHLDDSDEVEIDEKSSPLLTNVRTVASLDYGFLSGVLTFDPIRPFAYFNGYPAGGGSQGLYKVELNSSTGSATRLANAGVGFNMRSDGTYLYYTASGVGTDIRRVPVDGGASVLLHSSSNSGPFTLEVDGQYVYYAPYPGGGIYRRPKAGGAVLKLADISTGSAMGVMLLGADATHVYYKQIVTISGTDYSSVARVPKAGGAVTSIANGIDGDFTSFAQDAANIYLGFAKKVPSPADRPLLRRYPKAGGAPTILHQNSQAKFRASRIIGTTLYVTQSASLSDQLILSCPNASTISNPNPGSITEGKCVGVADRGGRWLSTWNTWKEDLGFITSGLAKSELCWAETPDNSAHDISVVCGTL